MEKVFCPKCGKASRGDSRYCYACGFDLGDSAPPEDERAASLPAAGNTGGTMGDGTLLEEEPKAKGLVETGVLVAGRYLIERELGKGGMGTVYLARDARLQDRSLALKFISTRILGSEGARRRFLTEAMASMELAHPHIIRVYQLDEWQGLAFLSMEYVQGCPLHELPELAQNNRQLPWNLVLLLVRQILDALEYAHSQGVIHRDLKPSNILVSREQNGSPRAVIMDFGLAKRVDSGGQTVVGARMGTPYYMAPEQLRDSSQADQRADLFSLGVIAYELLTGDLPIGDFDPPSRVRGGLPEGLDAWIARALKRDASQRFASAGDMLAAIEAIGVQGALKLGVQSARGEVQGKPQEARETRSTPKVGDVESVDLGNGLNMELVWVPAGSFQMGSPHSESGRDNDEGPVHTVEFDGFWMGKYEVTQEEWLAVMGNNPSSFKGGRNPVEKVSWNDVTDFCRKASQKTGKELRLPTEAEWEYACRAGSSTRFYFGDSDGGLGDYTWYGSNSGKQTHPVGEQKPNAWGLYDMHGNVWEWCVDWYAERYSAGSAKNPQGPSSGNGRVLRGGSWSDVPNYCRSANRFRGVPASTSDNRGFRVVAAFSG